LFAERFKDLMTNLDSTKLILFFTSAVSLRTWDTIGMFEREVALYRHLQEQGVQVIFVTYGDASDLKYAKRIPGIRILCNRWGLPSRFYERWMPILHAKTLFRADIYKTNQTRGADVALRAARMYRKPLIVRCGYMRSILMQASRNSLSSAQLKQAAALEQHVFRGADRVAVTTSSIKQYVMQQYNLSETKLRVIPNYVLTNIFVPVHRVSPNGKCLIFIGRLSEEKNPFGLLQAIRGLDVKLVIIGDGTQRLSLEEKAKKDNLCVQFLGNQPHLKLPHYLQAADIFILPSPSEGHPKALLEAMSCGLPVIGTDVPGIRELIRHRETGYLCGISPTEIRKAILNLLGDKALQTKMGENARKFIVDNFSIEHILKMELALLRELTTGKET
jgi:glycosyltransferase involved in cell wall biosynthesis